MHLEKPQLVPSQYPPDPRYGAILDTMRCWWLRCLLAVLLCYCCMQPTQLFARTTPPAQDQPLVTQEIRYRLAEAGEVYLIWGVNGWGVVREAQQPTGTVVKDGVMYTPMIYVDDAFVARIQVTPGTTIDYVFQITKTRSGTSIEVWDANGNPKQDYHTAVAQGGVAEVDAAPELANSAETSGAIKGGTQQPAIMLLLIGICIVFGVYATRTRFNGLTFKYLAYARANTAKLIAFAVATRVLLLFIGWLAYASYANANVQQLGLDVSYFKKVISSFRYADVEWYIGIAQNGYEHRAFSSAHQANWAFYPLWPIALRLGNVFIADIVVLGIVLSTMLFVLSVVYLYRLILIDFNENIAMTTAILMVIFPAAYFCSRPGPEALFLLLVVTSFFYAKKQKWILAGFLAAMAVLSRLQGIFLLLPLLYIYYQQYKASKRHNIRVVSLLMIPAALLGFMCYLYLITGNFFANIAIQDAWGNHNSYPLGSIVKYLTEPTMISYYGWDLSIVSFIFACASIILTIMMIRTPDIPRAYIIYTILSIYVMVSRDTVEASLRFLIPVFPVHLMVSRLIYDKKMLYNLMFFVFVALQLFYFISFIHHYNWAAT
jgi:Gpi18-like mannosyltransferase